MFWVGIFSDIEVLCWFSSTLMNYNWQNELMMCPVLIFVPAANVRPQWSCSQHHFLKVSISSWYQPDFYWPCLCSQTKRTLAWSCLSLGHDSPLSCLGLDLVSTPHSLGLVTVSILSGLCYYLILVKVVLTTALTTSNELIVFAWRLSAS